MKKPVNRRIVAYYRVSTEKQGRSGLGLDDQKAKINAYAAANGCVILGAYLEVETGTKVRLDNRPQLSRAIAHAKRSKAALVIAILDRLARNVAFISSLMESGIEFLCAESPTDDKFTLHIKASMAEEEGRKISERTRDALAAAKARGVKLGTNNLTRAGTLKGSAAGLATIAARKFEAYSVVTPIAQDFKAQGLSLRQIAMQLNAAGETTRSGQPWTATQVSRVLKAAHC